MSVAVGILVVDALGGLGSVRAGDILQALYAGSVLFVFAYYRQELLRVPAAARLFALGGALLAGALYIDAGPSHGQFLLPGTASLGSGLEPLQDSLKLMGFGAVLGGFVVIYGNAKSTSAAASPTSTDLSFSPSRSCQTRTS